MATYQVKPGDNLSSIAARLGVPMSSITGYKSGNPNLIYSGENLTYGGAAPMAAAAPAPAAPVADPNAGAPTLDTYLNQVKGEVDPQYKAIEDQTRSYYDTLKAELAQKIKDEYGRRGIMESSYYGDAFAKGESDSNLQKASALSQLALKKGEYIQGLAGSRYSDALKRWQQIQDDARAEKEYQRQLALSQAQATASAAKSSAKTSAKTTAYKNTAESRKLSLDAEIENARINAGKYVNTGNSTPMSSREALIKALSAKYGDIVDPDQIAFEVYRQIRGYKEAEFKWN